MDKKEMNEEKKNQAADTVSGEEKAQESAAAADEHEEHKESEAPKKKSAEKELKKLRSEHEKLKKELTEAKKAAEDNNEKYLRLAAEYDNFRKRSQKEREGIYADAAADSIKELLPLIDNLQRATQYTAPDKVAEGVAMILASLPDVFAKLKIEAFGAAGDKFDPNIHNAVMHIEDEALGESEITDVFQQGYRLGDKVIRYAMVKVAN